MDWPRFQTQWTFAWNYWRQNYKWYGETEKGCKKPAVQQKTTDACDCASSLQISSQSDNMEHSSAILNLRISEFCHVSIARVKICVWIPNVVKFGRFASEIWRYNYIQIGGRPRCWIYYAVIIEFSVLDIVLNSDARRFHTFWYTSTIMFLRFSLKVPIFVLTLCIIRKLNTGNIKFKCCYTQKAHLCWNHMF